MALLGAINKTYYMAEFIGKPEIWKTIMQPKCVNIGNVYTIDKLIIRLFI